MVRNLFMMNVLIPLILNLFILLLDLLSKGEKRTMRIFFKRKQKQKQKRKRKRKHEKTCINAAEKWGLFKLLISDKLPWSQISSWQSCWKFYGIPLQTQTDWCIKDLNVQALIKSFNKISLIGHIWRFIYYFYRICIVSMMTL